MEYIICETCGYEDNELGLKRCKSCGSELYYVDTDDFNVITYSDMEDEYLGDESERIEDEDFKEKVSKCKLTTGTSFEGYHITEYIDVIFDERIIGKR